MVFKTFKPTWRIEVGTAHFYFESAPNRFHRWMQKLCFGIKWVQLKDKP